MCPVGCCTPGDRLTGLEHASRALLVDAADVLLAPTLMAGLTATAILILLSPQGRAPGQWLAPAGRMALTCYLTQSLVLAFVFTGYGAGFVGRIGAAASVAIALALFLVQLAVSRWWMARHRYGPLEWLLRWATTLQRPQHRAGSKAHADNSQEAAGVATIASSRNIAATDQG